jgi:hypothetical protein
MGADEGEGGAVIIPVLFHWSPSERRREIEANGLQPYQLATVCSDPELTSPYICFSPTPSRAWALSGAMDWVSEIDQWDLWQATLADRDHVCVRSDFGPEIQEIKVYGSIPADRLWLVGSRGVPVLEPAAA